MNISTPYMKESKNDENYIPLAKPSITRREIAYVNDAMINGWGENKNNFIEKFERTFAKKNWIKVCFSNIKLHWRFTLRFRILGYKKR